MNNSLQFPYQTILTTCITFMGVNRSGLMKYSFHEHHLEYSDAEHASKPFTIDFDSISSISQIGNQVLLKFRKPIAAGIKEITLIINENDSITHQYIDYISSMVEVQNASNSIQTTSTYIPNNIDNENTSGNTIAKLWNNASALYIISAILFAISLIFIATINIGFVLVELIGVLFAIIMAIYFNSWKFFSIKDFSKVLFVAVIIGLILTIFALVIEGPNVNVGWQEEWHKCYKCNGSGKVRNDYGWNVTCPRCNGVGGLHY